MHLENETSGSHGCAMTTPSLEQEVKRFLVNKGVEFHDQSDSFKHLDFTILLHNAPYFHLEVKEKRQKYNMNHWPPYVDEASLFILDDLTVRKCLAYAPKSGVLVRDNVRSMYTFLSVVDLALMPRLRVNRPIQRTTPALKGKWLIDLNNGASADSIETIFSTIRRYVDASDKILYDTIECYGHYEGEEIARGGITREPSHWDTDVDATR